MTSPNAASNLAVAASPTASAPRSTSAPRPAPPVQADRLGFRVDGERLSGRLFRPAGDAPHPAVLLCHGGGGVQEIALFDFATRFAEGGVAAMTFDYSTWGESTGAPRHIIDLRQRHREIRAALDVLQAQAGVDPDRVALWGTSLGGGQVLHVASRRPDVAAVVIQCAAVDPRALAGSYDRVQLLRLLGAGVWDGLRRAMRLSPHYVGLIGEPGALAMMTTPDTLDHVHALSEGGLPIRNEVAARLVLELLAYRPVLDAPRIQAPLLVCVAERDSLIPGHVQRRAAELAPRGEARSYDAGHFEIYFGKWFEKMVPDQVAFLRRTLSAGG